MNKKILVSSAFLVAFGLIIFIGASCSIVDENVNTNTDTTLNLTPTKNTNVTNLNSGIKDDSVSVDKASYIAGETITATYKITSEIGDKAWIGVIPIDTPHGKEIDGDAVDKDYEYLNDVKSGSVELNAPLEAGYYDVRVYSDDSGNDAIELATTDSFYVDADDRVSVDKTDYRAGESVVASFVLSSDITSNAWIGIVPANTPHGSEEDADEVDVSYKYLDGDKISSRTFAAPDEAGTYQVRIYNSDYDADAKELASSDTFRVY